MADLSILVKNIKSQNIANDIEDEDLLKKLGQQVIEDFSRDVESMTDWQKGIEDGRDLAKQEINSKSIPWEGAANFKSPAILEAARSFGDRAVTEIIRGGRLVKGVVIGKDSQGLKKEAMERVTEFMNWQINYEMKGWRKRQECLIYELPATGTVFKKTFFDPIDQVNKSELIHNPDFAVNQASPTIEDAKSFTQVMSFSANEIFERQKADIWRDVELYPEDSEGDAGSNEAEQVDNSIDNPERFFEQNCWFDLDQDGYQEPYTVTVHESSGEVVRIIARYSMDGIIVKEDVTGKIRPVVEGDSLTDAELIKINATQNITKYGFIKDPNGTFLDVGYYHLLGPLTKALNVTTNQLLDAGTLANMPNGFLARGFRKKMGNLRMSPGSLQQTDISAQELQSGVLMNPFREPSQTLLALGQGLQAAIDKLVVSLDLQGTIAPNAPASTTLALIQEQMIPTSAIMQRIIDSQSDEFEKLFVLNSKFADPEQYIEVVDDPSADFQQDFNLKTMNIKPTANPEMSTKIQRIQVNDALLSQAALISQTGGDIKPIVERFVRDIADDDTLDQVYPDPAQMSEEQAARLETQQRQQAMQEELTAIQIDLQERQVQAIEQEGDRKSLETQAKIEKQQTEIEKIEAEIILTLEKAESEQAKNQISTYTAQIAERKQAIEELKQRNEEIRRNTTIPTRTSGIPESDAG